MYYMAAQDIADRQTKADLFHEYHLHFMYRWWVTLCTSLKPKASLLHKIMYKQVWKELNHTWRIITVSLWKRGCPARHRHPFSSMGHILQEKSHDQWDKESQTRLNMHDGKQAYIAKCIETFSPVVTWFAMEFEIVLAIILAWTMHQIAFIEVYAQAPFNCDIHMCYLLVLRKNIKTWRTMFLISCRLVLPKTSGCISNQYMVDKLQDIGFQHSQSNECAFFCDDINIAS